MGATWRERSWPVLASVLLHGLMVLGVIVAALLANHRTDVQVQPQPIDALVVDSQALRAARQVLADRAEQAAAQVRAAAEAKAAAARAAEEAAAAEAAKIDAAKAEAAEAARADAEAKAAAEAQAQAQAAAAQAAKAAAADAARAGRQRPVDAHGASAAQKAAQARHAETEQAIREAQAQQASDAKAAAAAQRAAQAEKAAAAKLAAAKQAESQRAAEDHARQEREDELKQQLADEEHRSAVQASPLRDRYIASLRNKIQGAWIKPPSAHVGVDCMVEVSQVPGGEVTGARVTQCNGDAAVRQSIENAVYRASPLPDPPDAALFEKKFVFRFRPNE